MLPGIIKSQLALKISPRASAADWPGGAWSQLDGRWRWTWSGGEGGAAGRRCSVGLLVRAAPWLRRGRAGALPGHGHCSAAPAVTMATAGPARQRPARLAVLLPRIATLAHLVVALAVVFAPAAAGGHGHAWHGGGAEDEQCRRLRGVLCAVWLAAALWAPEHSRARRWSPRKVTGAWTGGVCDHGADQGECVGRKCQ